MALITHFSLVVLCFRYNANFRVLTLYCVVIYVADDSVFFFFPQEQKDRYHIQHESFSPIEIIKIDLRYSN